MYFFVKLAAASLVEAKQPLELHSVAEDKLQNTLLPNHNNTSKSSTSPYPPPTPPHQNHQNTYHNFHPQNQLLCKI